MTDELAPQERLRRELNNYLFQLQDRVLSLLVNRDPIQIYNEIPALRSLIGQIDAAAARYCHKA